MKGLWSAIAPPTQLHRYRAADLRPGSGSRSGGEAFEYRTPIAWTVGHVPIPVSVLFSGSILYPCSMLLVRTALEGNLPFGVTWMSDAWAESFWL